MSDITICKENKNNKKEKDMDDMEKLIDLTILNLKIISKIKDNDKLISNNEIIEIDNPNLLQGLKRWYNNENRTITINKLNNICDATYKISEFLISKEKNKNNKDNILKISNNEIFQTLIIEMTNTIVGLENLKRTYSRDVLISSNLDIIIKKILNKIDKLNKLFSINITNYY